MDFKHPFLSNPRLAIYYVLFWIVAAAVSILLKWLSFGMDAGVAAIEFFSLPFMFAIVGTPIWYVIKFSTL